MIVDPVAAGLAIVAAFVLGGASALAWRRLVGDRRASTPAAPDASDPIAGPSMLQTLIDAIPAMINCKDRDGRYVLMNAYQAGLYGTTPEAAIRRTATDLLGVPYGVYTRSLDDDVVRTGQPVGPVHERYPDAQGRMGSWMTSKSPIKDREGHVTHIATVAFDMTEQKRIEGLLVQARNEAEAASRAKAAFLATMSHELRTPLNAIIGFSELMHEAIFGPLGSSKYEEYTRDVVESGRLLLAIINDILDLSKVEAGHMAFVAEALDLAELLDRCRRLVTPRAQREQIEIVVSTEERLPRAHADRRLLTQIVTNLLMNAVKFSSTGGRVALEATSRDGWIELRVVDQGIGMTEEEIAIALRPFEQVDREHARKQEGTGLGLPIVKGLVDLHGGELEIVSRPGAGTTVIVRLPAHLGDRAGRAAERALAASA